MAGGGLYALVAYGAQNVLLSGNPQMTYFYKAFKRYSHFAMENITIALDGPNQLLLDSPVQLRAKIPRYGDLMSDVIFTFTIPDIYSKYMTPSATRGTQWEFEWTRYIGAAIINNAALVIGGQTIQEFDGSYLLSRALLDLDQDAFYKWKYLVGDVDELTKPAKGAYAAGTTTAPGYPTVVATIDPLTSKVAGTQLNRPSIFGREIHVPLSFWFTEGPSQALPLVGLQYHECEIKLTLNPISQLYSILDASGYRVNSEFATVGPLQSINQNMPTYATYSDISGQIRSFFVDIGASTPPLNGWFLNPRLQTTFIYLPKEEQEIFATRPLSYLINQVTEYPFPGLYNRQVLDLQTHNPLTRLIFIQRRSDAGNRNDFANFTNWYTYPMAPYYPVTSLAEFPSGILLPNAQQDMIRGIRVLCDGNEIQEMKNTDFFTRYVTYRTVKGIGQDGLPIYSFQLGQSPTQPSGSLNASRIRNFQVEVDVFPLPPNTTYTYDLNIYVENINFLEIVSGMGGLKYAL